MVLPALPGAAPSLSLARAPAFSAPAWQRSQRLMAAAVLTAGPRTVAHLLLTAGSLARGHTTSSQRVLSAAAWSGLRFGCLLCGFVLRRLVPDGVGTLGGGDAAESHPGRRADGEARHRDPVRSGHAYTARRYGHKGIILAVPVRFPFATRPWALPVRAAAVLVLPGAAVPVRPHRTPARLLCRLLRLLLLRCPDRASILAGGAGDGTHAVARFVRRRDRLTLVGKRRPAANLSAPPPRYRGRGRPRVQGRPLRKPCEAAARRRRCRRLAAAWYGGGRRRVPVASGTRGWCANTVSRAAPCLFGQHTAVAVLLHALPQAKRPGARHWPGKGGGTCSDARTAVRRRRWAEGGLPQAEGGAAVEKLPAPLREIRFSALAPAA